MSTTSAWSFLHHELTKGPPFDLFSVALVDVIPNEIRWFKAESSMKQWIEVSKAKLTGQAAATGKLVIISKDEIDLVSRTHNTATA